MKPNSPRVLGSAFLAAVVAASPMWAPAAAAATVATELSPAVVATSDVPAGTPTNRVFDARTVLFNYTGGTVTFTSCRSSACAWAIDDAARLTVTRPDGSQATEYFESLTKDKAARPVTSLFRLGVNSVRIELIDLMGPNAGLPRSLFLVESSTSLPAGTPGVVSVPGGLTFWNDARVGFSRDPVNTRTGSFSYEHTDVAIAGRGPTPTFTRQYDSANTLVGDLGPGWTHNYAARLVRPDSTTPDLVVLGALGRADRYTFTGGRFVAPGGIPAELTKSGDGTYALSGKDQGVLAFDETGRLLRMTDRHGAQSTLTYDAEGRLGAVSDPAGRGSLTFRYDPSSARLARIVDWAGRAATYAYDAQGRLASFTDRESQTTRYGYDGASARITTVTDPLNRVAVTNGYDAQGRVASQKDARNLTTGQATTFAYTQNGDGSSATTVTYPKTSIEPSWNFVDVDTYDTQGRLTRRVSKPTSDAAAWITVERTYDGAGNLASVKDGRANTTLYCYDIDYAGVAIASRGNLTRVIEPPPSTGASRPVTLHRYDTRNNLVETVPPSGVASTGSTTCSSSLTSAVNPLFATTLGYDPETQTKLVTRTTRFTDPEQGPKSSITRYEYGDAANPGQATRIVPPRGNTGPMPDYSYATTLVYGTAGGGAGALKTMATATGAMTTFTHDAVGRVVRKVEPGGNVAGADPAPFTSQYSFDMEDRVRLAVTPSATAGDAPLVTERRYDGAGNEIALIEPDGQVTRYAYDERNSLKEVHQSPAAWTDPAVNPPGLTVTEYQHDELGNLNKVTRAKGDPANERVATYAYDGLGRLRRATEFPSWPATTSPLVSDYTYDKNGNQLSTKDPLLKTTTATFDALNRVTSITYNSSSTPNVSYQYNMVGGRTRMVDGTGTTNYSYDESGRLLSVQSPGPKTLAYRYDVGGNRRKLVYSDGKAITYAYDSADRLVGVSDWASRSSQYDYFVDGAVKSLTNFNGSEVHYAYDNLGRVADIWNKVGADTVNRYSYRYDRAGSRVRVDAVTAGGEWYAGPITPDRQGSIDYGYDRLRRLTSETRALPFPQDEETLTYTYDPVGNRLSETIFDLVAETTNFSYDRADRVKTATGESDEVFTVDANGNMTVRGWASGEKFTYDQANRMILAKPGAMGYRYFYDGDGKRTKVQSDSWWPTVYGTYLYDVNQPLPLLLEDTTQRQKIVWGLGPLYIVDADDKPGYYHTDALGSVRGITDYRGPSDHPRMQEYEEYRAFGIPGYSNRTFRQPFKFVGEMVDEDRTDYVHLRARDYDPAIGRFTSRDTVLGDVMRPQSLNRYTYVENDPVNAIDPSGHTPRSGGSGASRNLRPDFGGGTAGASATLILPARCVVPGDLVNSIDVLSDGVSITLNPDCVGTLLDPSVSREVASRAISKWERATGQRLNGEDSVTCEVWGHAAAAHVPIGAIRARANPVSIEALGPTCGFLTD